jgi:hypothetical protein
MTSPFDGPDLPAPVDSDEVVLGEGAHPDTPFCPGFEADQLDLCESDADCGDDRQCYYENAPSGCTLGCAGPMDECSAAAPCPGDLLCVGTPAAEITSPCACGGGTYCKAPCGSDDDCAAGMSCQADGRCEPTPCDDGYDCYVSQVCDPTAPQADEHGCRFLHCTEAEHPGCGTNLVCDPAAPNVTGCVRQSCTIGADCECGACSPHGNECVQRPGFCAANVSTG